MVLVLLGRLQQPRTMHIRNRKMSTLTFHKKNEVFDTLIFIQFCIYIRYFQMNMIIKSIIITNTVVIQKIQHHVMLKTHDAYQGYILSHSNDNRAILCQSNTKFLLNWCTMEPKNIEIAFESIYHYWFTRNFRYF